MWASHFHFGFSDRDSQGQFRPRLSPLALAKLDAHPVESCKGKAMKYHLPLCAANLLAPGRRPSVPKPCCSRVRKHDLAKLLDRLHPPISRPRPHLALSLIKRVGLDLYLAPRRQPLRMSFRSFMAACHLEAWLETQILLARLMTPHFRSAPPSSTHGGDSSC